VYIMCCIYGCEMKRQRKPTGQRIIAWEFVSCGHRGLDDAAGRKRKMAIWTLL
jgi:hypothetical protein